MDFIFIGSRSVNKISSRACYPIMLRGRKRSLIHKISFSLQNYCVSRISFLSGTFPNKFTHLTPHNLRKKRSFYHLVSKFGCHFHVKSGLKFFIMTMFEIWKFRLSVIRGRMAKILTETMAQNLCHKSKFSKVKSYCHRIRENSRVPLVMEFSYHCKRAKF